MWILKKINNNCALARDDSGQDVVVFGKGIAYRKLPYELDDMSLIERTFYGVEGASLAALEDISREVLMLAADIMDYASAKIGTEFNPNAPVTLADHIGFAISRVERGVVVETPLAFDVKHLYPREVSIGKRAVTLVKSRLGVELPAAEITNIALHIIDAESEQSNMGATILATKVVEGVMEIVEEHLERIDVSSFIYARFVTHLRFLVGRIQSGEKTDAKLSPMLPIMKREYPGSYECVEKILNYLSTEWGWECDDSEALYLLIHIQRLSVSA